MKLKWDKTIKIGDLITGFYGGYFIITGIEKRKDESPLATMQLKLDKNGQIAKKTRIETCDMSYCTKITKEKVVSIITYNNEQFLQLQRNLLDLVTEKENLWK